MRIRLLFVGFILALSICVGVRTASAQVAATPTTAEADEQTEDEHAFIRSVRTQLVEEKFDDLDRTADEFRRDKSRWPGGAWKLKTLYEALDAPHQTDKDTADHLDHLRKWMTARPESITARIALATSLHRWAWVARGSGTADKVTQEGWQLFNQRTAEAQVVLEGSRDMKVMCPQWYFEEMTVGLAEGWDGRRMQELFDRAVQFEPEYQYFYKARANYLLPKWYGQTNDATDFARTIANKLGGDRGDRMYFVIATVIIRRGNGKLDHVMQAMDWQRIQRGYLASTSMYGVPNSYANSLAFMAYQYRDQAVAERQFASIGNNWARSVWKDKGLFDRARDWSAGHTQWQ